MASEAPKKIDLFAVNKDIIQLYKKYFIPLLYFGLFIALISFFDGKMHHKTESIEALFPSFIFSTAIGVLNTIGTAILLWFIDRREQGKTIDITESFKASRPRILLFITASYLVGIITVSGLLLLFIPGIIWWLMFSQAALFVLYKKQGVRQALSSSRQLTKGHRWFLFRMNAQLLIAGIIFFGLGSIISTMIEPVNKALVPTFEDLFSTVGQMLLISFVVAFDYGIWRALNKAN